MINYTIIIPHHNVPDLLQRCLDSIPIRDDLEVIIVDDNSSSDIVDFLNFPGMNRKDCRIIFDKDGGGAGHARNLGLKQARGKWVVFADSDDFFTHCFSEVLDAEIENDADIIYMPSSCIDADFYTNNNCISFVQDMIASFIHGDRKSEYQLRYHLGFPWGKFVKRLLIEEHSIRFDETIIHNDTTFAYLIGYHAKKIAANMHAIYCYTVRGNSLSHTITEEKKVVRVEVMGRSNLFFKEHNLPMREDWQYRQLIESFFENKNTFKKEWYTLKRIGYPESELYINFFKTGVRILRHKVLHKGKMVLKLILK